MRIDAPQIAEIGDVFVRPPELRFLDEFERSNAENDAVKARLHATFDGFIAAPTPETD